MDRTQLVPTHAPTHAKKYSNDTQKHTPWRDTDTGTDGETWSGERKREQRWAESVRARGGKHARAREIEIEGGEQTDVMCMMPSALFLSRARSVHGESWTQIWVLDANLCEGKVA